jgi:hypothetical protein
VYAGSAYELTSQVAQADEWTPNAISERQKTLATLAPKTWPAIVSERRKLDLNELAHKIVRAATKDEPDSKKRPKKTQLKERLEDRDAPS